ncbi:minor capsid protein [Clostridium sulfidigenes]|uniref:minor capsid protein n=1 Tax=Clostridium sulfidigenes TaxID=318464 RepID=UPI003F8AFD36
MATNVRVDIDDSQKILLKRYLNKNGRAQVEFTKQVAKYSNNYTPFKTGRLKDMMITLSTDKITYNAPYAAKQYYTNKGMGKQGNSQGGLRGKMWDRRMWIDKGDNIVKTIAQFVGGKSK